jgi:IS4 transposase
MVQFMSKAMIIRELLEEAQRHVEVLMVYLDRGFYSAACLRELEDSGVRYMMPVPSNKAVRRLKAELLPRSRVVGTRGWSYSKAKRSVGDKDKMEVQTVFLFNPDPEDVDFVFITNIEVNDYNVEALVEDYGRRWGIETGYRMSEMVRGRTCSRSHAVRRLLHLLSLLLYNVWQLVDALLVHVFGVPRKRWGYTIRLRSFMRWLGELSEMGDVGVGI